MKEYIEYNTKQGITDLLSEIELDDEKGWVEGMHKGEMIASVKLPNNNFNYNEMYLDIFVCLDILCCSMYKYNQNFKLVKCGHNKTII